MIDRAGLCAALLCAGCAALPAGESAPILTPSARESHWPVEGETRPGIWFRLDPSGAPASTPDLLDGLRILIDHGHRTQVLTGAAFSPLVGSRAMQQTRYLYTPTSGTLFVTLQLTARGRDLFPDTQRIELNDDCWHILTWRVRGPLPSGPPPPPPYPRTSFLSASLSGDPPLYLDVFISGNCFRNPLPPS
jgi:hypothetical protein